MDTPARRIPIKALGLFRHGNAILVSRAFDSTKGDAYFRPPGGTVEFGERASDTVRREIREELGAEIQDVTPYGVFENHFVYEGLPGHEIVYVFEAGFQDRALYETASLTLTESDGEVFEATWVATKDFVSGKFRLVPEALLARLADDRSLVILDAPTNLGLSPPTPDSEPGCSKMPWVLHNLGLVPALGAVYRGVVVPPAYHGAWDGHGDRNAPQIAEYSVRLADRVHQALVEQSFPVVLGGDCSVLLANALALRRLGNYGLVFVDAHSDYRHPGNSPNLRAAAGEDLALVTGKGDPRLVDLEGRGPSVEGKNVVALGVLDTDEDIPEMRRDGVTVFTNVDLVAGVDPGPAVDGLAGRTDGFWVHVDFDVVDASQMSAVDCPENTGVSFARLGTLLRPIVDRPGCVGIEFTIYDPDRDPGFVQGQRVFEFIVGLLGRSLVGGASG